MARLQILQLPEGAGDDRPPWLLIVDELPTGDAQLDMLRRDLADNDITARIGARGALCFESTINLPANEPMPLLPVQGDSQTGELIDAHEQTRLALCDAFCLSLDTTWTRIVDTARQRQQELAGLYRKLDAAPKTSHDQRKAALADALGMDPLRDWDDICNAAAGLRKQRDAQGAAIERVRALADRWDSALAPARSQYSGPVRAALDGTEQPTTGRATNADEPTVKP